MNSYYKGSISLLKSVWFCVIYLHSKLVSNLKPLMTWLQSSNRVKWEGSSGQTWGRRDNQSQSRLDWNFPSSQVTYNQSVFSKTPESNFYLFYQTRSLFKLYTWIFGLNTMDSHCRELPLISSSWEYWSERSFQLNNCLTNVWGCLTIEVNLTDQKDSLTWPGLPSTRCLPVDCSSFQTESLAEIRWLVDWTGLTDTAGNQSRTSL